MGNGVAHGAAVTSSPLNASIRRRNLHILALALFAHARLEQAAQGGERLRQLPARQGRGLVERANLLLNQGKVMCVSRLAAHQHAVYGLVPILHFTIRVGMPRQIQLLSFLRVGKLNCVVHSLLVLLVLRIRRQIMRV